MLKGTLYEVNIGDNDMATVMSSEREPTDVESLPEYVRDQKLRSRDSLEFVSSKPASAIDSLPLASNEPEGPQTDILEALWPGVHQEFAHPVRRPPSFYLTVGFMGGAAISLVAVWLYSTVPSVVAGFGKPNGNTVVAQVTSRGPATSGAAVTGSEDTVAPTQPTYEVQSGDTLAAIALHNYKRVSPRLLDEICAANNMKNANVLMLGQKITLPVYHPQARGAQSQSTSTVSNSTGVVQQ